MSAYIRFQTNLRSRHGGSPLGIFCAPCEYERVAELPDYVQDQLEESFTWFNENLLVPRLDYIHWRTLFWFRADAHKVLANVWPIVALLNESGVFVHKFQCTEPGTIVYSDVHQVAAIPQRYRRLRNARPARGKHGHRRF